MLVAIKFDEDRVVERGDGLIVLSVPQYVKNNHAFRVLTMEGRSSDDYHEVMGNVSKRRGFRIKRAKSVWIGPDGGLIVRGD